VTLGFQRFVAEILFELAFAREKSDLAITYGPPDWLWSEMRLRRFPQDSCSRRRRIDLLELAYARSTDGRVLQHRWDRAVAVDHALGANVENQL